MSIGSRRGGGRTLGASADAGVERKRPRVSSQGLELERQFDFSPLKLLKRWSYASQVE